VTLLSILISLYEYLYYFLNEVANQILEECNTHKKQCEETHKFLAVMRKCFLGIRTKGIIFFSAPTLGADSMQQ